MRRRTWMFAVVFACLALAGCAREPAPGNTAAPHWDQARWDRATWAAPKGGR